MKLNVKLAESVAAAAEGVRVDQVIVGLGYTAVITSNNAIGIAATGVALDGCRSGSLEGEDFEDRPATDLLQAIMGADPMGRTMALALINALNHSHSLTLPEDPGNARFFDHYGIRSGARVAMVGYFPPLVRLIEAHKIALSVIDDGKGLGDKKVFYRQLGRWADVLLMTATSIINNTTESILSHVGPNVKTVLLGPTTPLIPQAFDHLPIHMLAGAAITDRAQALKVVRHGGGPRCLKPFSRKVYCYTAKENHQS